MFTGLIQDIGHIKEINEGSGDTLIKVHTGIDLNTIDIGASIACNGVCLTAIDKGESWFSVEASAETLSKTELGNWSNETRINIETSLKMGDEIGGHFVFGHVDGLASLAKIIPSGDSYVLDIQPPPELMPYIAQKGSIALNGVSLTVNAVFDEYFQINIIPHTWEHTNLKEKKLGEHLNIEIDMLARYVQRMMKFNKAG